MASKLYTVKKETIS